MKKNKLMIMGVTIFMLAACGSNNDVDAVADLMVEGGNVNAEEAKCVAKGLNKEMDSEVWDGFVKLVKEEIDEDDMSPDIMMGMLAPMFKVTKACGVENMFG
jgi:polyhydroxyalkanoate synthesis regulator phasin